MSQQCKLHDAIKDDNFELVNTLIASGANVNEKDGLNRTPLHLAAWKGNLDIVQLLIRSRASVDELARDGFTCLHFAVQHGDPSVVEILAKKRRHLISQRITKGHKTPLHLAAAKNNIEVVRKLIELGADVSAQTNKRETAFDLTSSEDIRQILRDAVASKIQKLSGSKRLVDESDDDSTKADEVSEEEEGGSKQDAEGLNPVGEKDHNVEVLLKAEEVNKKRVVKMVKISHVDQSEEEDS